MLKRKWGAESNGKLPHLFIPGKTEALVPALAVKDLPMDSSPDDVREAKEGLENEL